MEYICGIKKLKNRVNHNRVRLKKRLLHYKWRKSLLPSFRNVWSVNMIFYQLNSAISKYAKKDVKLLDEPQIIIYSPEEEIDILLNFYRGYIKRRYKNVDVVKITNTDLKIVVNGIIKEY